jgi:hypothetical protein
MQQTQNDLYSLLVSLLELNLVNEVVNPGRACWQPNFSFGPKWLILLRYFQNMRSKEWPFNLNLNGKEWPFKVSEFG